MLLPTISGCFPEARKNKGNGNQQGNQVIAHYIGLFSSVRGFLPGGEDGYCPLYRAVFH